MNTLIVGATSGIGKALWQHYVSQNHNVAIIGRRAELLNAIKAEVPTLTFSYKADIADISFFNQTFNEILKELNSLDLVIICAGIGELNPKLNVDTELSTIATNVLGWTNILDRTYSLFEQQGFGHLVTITSVGGMQPTPVAPSYSASKAFQINYTKSLQAKAKKTKIKITEIRPGLVDTRMAKGEGLFWVMPLSKVVPQIIKAIDRKKNLCIVTKRWRILNYSQTLCIASFREPHKVHNFVEKYHKLWTFLILTPLKHFRASRLAQRLPSIQRQCSARTWILCRPS